MVMEDSQKIEILPGPATGKTPPGAKIAVYVRLFMALFSTKSFD